MFASSWFVSMSREKGYHVCLGLGPVPTTHNCTGFTGEREEGWESMLRSTTSCFFSFIFFLKTLALHVKMSKCETENVWVEKILRITHSCLKIARWSQTEWERARSREQGKQQKTLSPHPTPVSQHQKGESRFCKYSATSLAFNRWQLPHVWQVQSKFQKWF